jgi:hypothetical protein
VNDNAGIIARRRETIARLRAEIDGIVRNNRRTHAAHMFSEWVALMLRLNTETEQESIRSTDIAAVHIGLGLNTSCRMSGVNPGPDEHALAVRDIEYLRSIDGVPLSGCPTGRPQVLPSSGAVTDDETMPLDNLNHRELSTLKRRLWEQETNLREERDRLRSEFKRIQREHTGCRMVSFTMSYTVKMHPVEVPFGVVAHAAKRVLSRPLPFNSNREAA